MTDQRNTLATDFLGTASVFPMLTAQSSQLVGTYHEPHDAYRQTTGLEVRRFFRTDRPAPWSILLCNWVTVPAAPSLTHMLWDLGSNGAGVGNSNAASGGYGLQIAGRTLEFLWRDENVTTPPTTLLSFDLDVTGSSLTNPVPHPPSFIKHGLDFMVGVAIHKLPEGHYVDLWLDGALVRSVLIPSGQQVLINSGAGLTLWAEARDPTDGDALGKVMNGGAGDDNGFRFSSFFAQRLESDKSDRVAQIMADCILQRQQIPARGVGL